MSDQATIFELPYNLFLMQRMEFVVICGDQLAASIMRVIEAEMIKRKEAWQARVEKAIENKKPLPKEPKTWWVQLSQAQIIARLYMFDSAKITKPESEDLNSPEWVEYRYKRALSISKATLKKAIELLKSLGFLIERSKPGDEFGAPIYTLIKDNVQKALKALPTNPFAIFHHLGGHENSETGGESKNFDVPPQNSDSGESKNLTVPPKEFSPGESKNFRVDIDSIIDPLEDTEIDNEIEDTDAHASTPAQLPPHFHRVGEFIGQWGYYYHPSKPWLRWDSLLTPAVIVVVISGDAGIDRQRKADGLELLQYLSQQHADIELHYQPEAEATPPFEGSWQPPASTPVRDEDTPYVPDFSAHTPRELIPVVSEEIEHVETMKEQERIRIAAQPSDPAQGVGYEKPRARAEPRKSKRGQNKDTFKVYFSVEGAAFRAWYEEIFETKLDETAANARACNALGKRESVTYENVQFVKREIDLNKWARENNVVPTPQDLAREDGNIRWEKWLQSAQKRAKQPQRAQPKGDNNLADWVAESERQQAQISPEESARRTEEARRQLAAVQRQIAAQKTAAVQQQTIYYPAKGEVYAR